jgi:hypothetical protein
VYEKNEHFENVLFNFEESFEDSSIPESSVILRTESQVASSSKISACDKRY